MARYPAEPLESKLEWMRERQRKQQAKAAKLPAPPPVMPRKLPRMLRINEVAEILGVSRLTVRRVFRKQAVKLRGCVLISEEAVNKALRRH